MILIKLEPIFKRGDLCLENITNRIVRIIACCEDPPIMYSVEYASGQRESVLEYFLEKDDRVDI